LSHLRLSGLSWISPDMAALMRRRNARRTALVGRALQPRRL
jgi:hypothetical protein